MVSKIILVRFVQVGTALALNEVKLSPTSKPINNQKLKV